MADKKRSMKNFTSGKEREKASGKLEGEREKNHMDFKKCNEAKEHHKV